jgi:hypothetical protein
VLPPLAGDHALFCEVNGVVVSGPAAAAAATGAQILTKTLFTFFAYQMY